MKMQTEQQKIKRVNGAPKIPIDWETVGKLFSFGCSIAEVAAYVGLSYDRLVKRYNEEIATEEYPNLTLFKMKNTSKGDLSLRSKQYQKAMSGNTEMLKWLGVHRLGQKISRLETVSEEANAFREQVANAPDSQTLLARNAERPALEAKQPLLHQKPGGAQDPLPVQLGAENPSREPPHLQPHPQSAPAGDDDVFLPPMPRFDPMAE